MSQPTPVKQEMFRVLMLHGFGQSAQRFRAKTRQLTDRITTLLSPVVSTQYPGGIEFVFLDAPIQLSCPIGLESEKTPESEVAGIVEDAEDPESRAWWYGRDDINEYKGLDETLAGIAKYLHEKPVHGVIGFSQGAALGAMIGSLLECGGNPAKAEALREQKFPVEEFIRLPCQEPLKFLVCFSGYRGTLRYYGSLYRWPLCTPAFHTIAIVDPVVTLEQTLGLVRSFTSPQILYHYGSHFVPRGPEMTERIAGFVWRSCSGQGGECLPTVPLDFTGKKLSKYLRRGRAVVHPVRRWRVKAMKSCQGV